MGVSKLPEDRAILQAKFENVNRLLQQYGDGIKRVEAALATLDILEPNASVESIVERAMAAFVSLSILGVDTSLIQDDLEAANHWLGFDFAQEIRSAHLEAVNRLARAQVQPHGSDYRNAVRFFLAFVLDAAHAMSTPARLLRDNLMQQLNRSGRENAETPNQLHLRVRNQQILYLSKIHKTKSPRKLKDLTDKDPVLKALADKDPDSERHDLTMETIRNIVSPRKQRKSPSGKTASPKIPVKQKSQKNPTSTRLSEPKSLRAIGPARSQRSGPKR